MNRLLNMAFSISTWYIILTIIPLIFSRTPDETSPPPAPTDVYQLIVPPSASSGYANPNPNPESQNQHPYSHQKSSNNDLDRSQNSQNINNAQNVNSIMKQYSTTTPTPASGCFYRERDDCPKSTDNCRCKQLTENSARAVCCDVTSDFLLKEGLTCGKVGITDDVTELHIRNATLLELNLTLTNFRRLKSLSITDGNIEKVVGMFLSRTPIQCLNLSSNHMQSIEQRGITPLRHLSTLDLSHNNLTALPNLNQDKKILLDISGNQAMPCQKILNAKNNYTNLDFENNNNTFCTISKNFHWFNATSLLPLKQVEEYYNAQHNCWPNCTCQVYRTDFLEGRVPTIAFKVDCSGQQLTEMPSELPKNTIVLNISNNNISILKMDNESFGNIRELYADNNQIKSILSLEGTKFLDNFVALSLRNNTLKTLPSYMLSHIFDRNVNTRHVHFGLNRLHCDCNTAKNLRVWLLTKEKIIQDYAEIYCENSPQKVIHLDPASMCQDSKQNWTDYIYYIITAEVLLLVCLVLKVSYDYWVFKTAGYLPWPANKMPKLPCDWLCE